MSVVGQDPGTKREKETRTAERDMGRTVEKERAEVGLTSWAAAAAVFKDRDKWSQLISGLIPLPGGGGDGT